LYLYGISNRTLLEQILCFPSLPLFTCRWPVWPSLCTETDVSIRSSVHPMKPIGMKPYEKQFDRYESRYVSAQFCYWSDFTSVNPIPHYSFWCAFKHPLLLMCVWAVWNRSVCTEIDTVVHCRASGGTSIPRPLRSRAASKGTRTGWTTSPFSITRSCHAPPTPQSRWDQRDTFVTLPPVPATPPASHVCNTASHAPSTPQSRWDPWERSCRPAWHVCDTTCGSNTTRVIHMLHCQCHGLACIFTLKGYILTHTHGVYFRAHL
jgi:hypothetical protein